jgi:glycosyltransferase involved in cell wall biosynthesis
MSEKFEKVLVSIIIPTHNRAALLPEAINSALTQTHPAVEVIVVDDGSKDNTPAVAAQFGHRIRYIRQDNAGVSAARNRGFMESKGEFIGFLDDDDVYLEDKIALQTAALLEHTAAPAANCNFYFMSHAGAMLSHNGIVPAHDTFKNLLLANYIWMSGPLIRRSALIEAGLFAPEFSLAADLDMWLRLSQLGDFAVVQKPVGAYRIQQGSMVTKADLAEADCMAVLHRAYQNLSPSAEDQMLRRRSEAQWRLWFGANYLNSCRPEDFKRNYQQSFEACPEMFRDEKFMIRRLAQDFLHLRVHDTEAFANAFFNNLPAALSFVHGYRDQIQRRIDLLWAFDEMVNRDFERGKCLLQRALLANPCSDSNAGLHQELLFELAMCAKEGAQAYLEKVYPGMPQNDACMTQVVNRVQQDVAVWEGYLAYQQGDHEHARSRLLAGISRRPAWLLNRGIAKVFMQSLLPRRRARVPAMLL